MVCRESWGPLVVLSAGFLYGEYCKYVDETCLLLLLLCCCCGGGVDGGGPSGCSGFPVRVRPRPTLQLRMRLRLEYPDLTVPTSDLGVH